MVMSTLTGLLVLEGNGNTVVRFPRSIGTISVIGFVWKEGYQRG